MVDWNNDELFFEVMKRVRRGDVFANARLATACAHYLRHKGPASSDKPYVVAQMLDTVADRTETHDRRRDALARMLIDRWKVWGVPETGPPAIDRPPLLGLVPAVFHKIVQETMHETAYRKLDLPNIWPKNCNAKAWYDEYCTMPTGFKLALELMDKMGFATENKSNLPSLVYKHNDSGDSKMQKKFLVGRCRLYMLLCATETEQFRPWFRALWKLCNRVLDWNHTTDTLAVLADTVNKEFQPTRYPTAANANTVATFVSVALLNGVCVGAHELLRFNRHPSTTGRTHRAHRARTELSTAKRFRLIYQKMCLLKKSVGVKQQLASANGGRGLLHRMLPAFDASHLPSAVFDSELLNATFCVRECSLPVELRWVREGKQKVTSLLETLQKQFGSMCVPEGNKQRANEGWTETDWVRFYLRHNGLDPHKEGFQGKLATRGSDETVGAVFYCNTMSQQKAGVGEFEYTGVGFSVRGYADALITAPEAGAFSASPAELYGAADMLVENVSGSKSMQVSEQQLMYSAAAAHCQHKFSLPLFGAVVDNRTVRPDEDGKRVSTGGNMRICRMDRDPGSKSLRFTWHTQSHAFLLYEWCEYARAYKANARALKINTYFCTRK